MNIWPLPNVKLEQLNTVNEKRPVALITAADDWANVRRNLSLPLLIQSEPTQNSTELFNHLAETLPSPVEAIYAIGDNPTVLNAAKYVASQTKKPLVIVPVTLGDLEILTPEAIVNGQRVTTGPANEVIIDLELIGRAPSGGRGAAVAVLVAVITALRDWGYAAQKNQLNEVTKFNAWAASVAANLAQQAMKIAPAVGRGDNDAIRNLIELFCMVAKLDNLFGHRRATRGAEHIFAEAIVEQPGAANVPYTERLAAGILVAAALHKMDTTGLRAALEGAGIPLNSVRADAANATLNQIRSYATRTIAPYGILNDLTPGSEEIATAITKSTLV